MVVQGAKTNLKPNLQGTYMPQNCITRYNNAIGKQINFSTTVGSSNMKNEAEQN